MLRESVSFTKWQTRCWYVTVRWSCHHCQYAKTSCTGNIAWDSQQVFLSFLKSQPDIVCRVDIMWDVYIPDSLKFIVRKKRGTGTRRRVQPDNKIPNNWQDLTKINLNFFIIYHKNQLPVVCSKDQTIVSTLDKTVLILPRLQDISEEADTRLLLHALDATKHGHKKLIIRTVDSDVLIIVVALCNAIKAEELWIAFGTGQNLRYLWIACAIPWALCDQSHC